MPSDQALVSATSGSGPSDQNRHAVGLRGLRQSCAHAAGRWISACARSAAASKQNIGPPCCRDAGPSIVSQETPGGPSMSGGYRSGQRPRFRHLPDSLQSRPEWHRNKLSVGRPAVLEYQRRHSRRPLRAFMPSAAASMHAARQGGHNSPARAQAPPSFSGSRCGRRRRRRSCAAASRAAPRQSPRARQRLHRGRAPCRRGARGPCRAPARGRGCAAGAPRAWGRRGA